MRPGAVRALVRDEELAEAVSVLINVGYVALADARLAEARELFEDAVPLARPGRSACCSTCRPTSAWPTSCSATSGPGGADPTDRRAKLVLLTPADADAMRRTRALIAAMEADYAELLGPDRYETMREAPTDLLRSPRCGRVAGGRG